MDQRSYSVKTVYLIVIAAAIKLLVAPLLELGIDEVYYWTYAVRPDWNQFDHPPMVGLLIRLTTLNLWWPSELSFRLGSVLVAACSTWILFKLGKLISGERTGWFAALLYTASVYTGFIAGFFILPDTPQMLFWTASLYLMAYLLMKRNKDKVLSIWLLLGLMIGLATLSKVHGLYLWAGFGLFLLLKRTSWLLNWRLYAGVFVTILCILPIVYWNWENNFITYKFHSERVTHTGLQWESLIREIGGEFAYQNPVVYVLLLLSVIALLTNRIRFNQRRTGIWLFCMSIPMILIFWLVALFNPTLPHWSGPAFIPLFLIGALYLDKMTTALFPEWIKISLSLVGVVLVAAVVLVHYAPRNFGSQDKENYGEYCPTLDLSGWSDLGKTFTQLVQKDRADQLMRPDASLLVNNYFPGGHIEFYVSRPSGLPVIGVGKLQDLHIFAWLNKDRPPLRLGADAYCIVPSNFPMNVADAYGDYFTTILPPVELRQIRNGGVVRYFYIYRLKNCKKVPAPLL